MKKIFLPLLLFYAPLSYATHLGTTRGGQEITRADFTVTNTNLSGADLTGANLSGADLTKANFTGANLAYTDLRGLNLEGLTFLEQ